MQRWRYREEALLVLIFSGQVFCVSTSHAVDYGFGGFAPSVKIMVSEDVYM